MKSSRRSHHILRVKGGKVAWTNTSREPDRLVREAIRFVAKEINLNGVIIHVKKQGNARRWGMAYDGIPGIANTEGLDIWEWRYLIVVSDAMFFHTLAHEAKHIEQFRERLRRVEAACDAFAGWLEERWDEHRKSAMLRSP